MSSLTSSGSIGAVSLGSVVANVSNWSANVKETSHSAVTSASRKGAVVISGTKDWDGSFSAYGVSPPSIPGTKITFTGYTGADGTDTGGSISGPVIIGSLATTINIGTGEPIKWDVTFSGTGAAVAGTTTLSDTNTPELVSVAGASVKINGTVTTLNVSQITMNFQSAISGGTATSNSGGWLLRFAGPYSGTVGITVLDTKLDADMDIGDDLELEITLSNSKVLTVKYVHITDFSGVSIDNSSAEPIQFTINGTWNCHNGIAFGEVSVDETDIWSST